MKTNKESIQEVINVIETHLNKSLTLDFIASYVNYSKYHLCRLFSSIVGCSIHQYIQRRRLTQAAEQLVFTNQSILSIALSAGYDSQQAFTHSFKKSFHNSPQIYRKKQKFYPLQLPYQLLEDTETNGKIILEIREEIADNKTLVGYHTHTKNGFWVIGRCWHKLHANKHQISYRTETAFTIGVQDYTNWELEKDVQPGFDYFATVEVSHVEESITGMVIKELPASCYIVFSYCGKCEDSNEAVANYIYQEWLPRSNCQLNEAARFDFVKYGEHMDEKGNSVMEYWIPICATE